MAKDFLSFVVCKALLGDHDQIKETTIAVFVFKEPADFDPAESSKIRLAALNLRLRIPAYYANQGRLDPIRIALPPKGYVPEIRDRRCDVAVTDFADWSSKDSQEQLCGWITEVIVDRLNQARWIQAAQEAPDKLPLGSPRFRLRGSVEVKGDTVKVNVSLGETATDRILFSTNAEDELERVFGLIREIAEQLIELLRLELDGQNVVNPSPKPARAMLRGSSRCRRRIN
jgi:TolB-like protein